MVSNVTVFCGSSDGARPEYIHAAEGLARAMHAKGLGLVYGGGNKGLMGRVSGTMVALGGRVTGVIPESMTRIEGLAVDGNTILVPDMHTRKARMNQLCDAFIALPGGYGTFEEIMEMVTWSQLGIHAKPMVVVNVCGYFEHLRALVDHAIAEGFVRESVRDIIVYADTPEECVDCVLSYVVPSGRYDIKWGNAAEP